METRLSWVSIAVSVLAIILSLIALSQVVVIKTGLERAEAVRTPNTVEFTVLNELVGGKTRFTPPFIAIDKGDIVKFRVENITDALHNFTLEEYNIKKDLPPQSEVTVAFTARKAGLFRAFCSYHETHLPMYILVME